MSNITSSNNSLSMGATTTTTISGNMHSGDVTLANELLIIEKGASLTIGSSAVDPLNSLFPNTPISIIAGSTASAHEPTLQFCTYSDEPTLKFCTHSSPRKEEQLLASAKQELVSAKQAKKSQDEVVKDLQTKVSEQEINIEKNDMKKLMKELDLANALKNEAKATLKAAEQKLITAEENLFAQEQEQEQEHPQLSRVRNAHQEAQKTYVNATLSVRDDSCLGIHYLEGLENELEALEGKLAQVEEGHKTTVAELETKRNVFDSKKKEYLIKQATAAYNSGNLTHERYMEIADCEDMPGMLAKIRCYVTPYVKGSVIGYTEDPVIDGKAAKAQEEIVLNEELEALKLEMQIVEKSYHSEMGEITSTEVLISIQIAAYKDKISSQKAEAENTFKELTSVQQHLAWEKRQSVKGAKAQKLLAQQEVEQSQENVTEAFDNWKEKRNFVNAQAKIDHQAKLEELTQKLSEANRVLAALTNDLSTKKLAEQTAKAAVEMKVLTGGWDQGIADEKAESKAEADARMEVLTGGWDQGIAEDALIARTAVCDSTTLEQDAKILAVRSNAYENSRNPEEKAQAEQLIEESKLRILRRMEVIGDKFLKSEKTEAEDQKAILAKKKIVDAVAYEYYKNGIWTFEQYSKNLPCKEMDFLDAASCYASPVLDSVLAFPGQAANGLYDFANATAGFGIDGATVTADTFASGARSIGSGAAGFGDEVKAAVSSTSSTVLGAAGTFALIAALWKAKSMFFSKRKKSIDVSDLKNNLEAAKTMQTESEAKVTQLAKKLETANNDLAIASQLIKDGQSMNSKLRDQQEELVAGANKQLAEAEKKTTSLIGKLKVAGQQAEKAQSKYSELTATYKELVAKSEELQKRLLAAKSLQEGQDAEIATALRELSGVKKSLTSVQVKERIAQTRLKGANENVGALSDRLDTSVAAQKEAENLLRIANVKNADLSGKVSSIEKELTVIQGELEKKNSLVAEQKRECSALKAKFDTEVKAKEVANAALDASKLANSELSNKVTLKDKEIAVLNAAVVVAANLNKDNLAANKEVMNALEASLANSMQVTQQAQARIKQEEAKVMALTDANTKAQIEHEKALAAKAEIVEEKSVVIEGLKKAVFAAKNQNLVEINGARTTLQANVSLQAKVKEQTTAATVVQERLAAIAAEKVQVEARLAVAEQKEADVKSQLTNVVEHAQAEKAQAARELAEANATKADVESRLTDVGNERNLATVALLLARDGLVAANARHATELEVANTATQAAQAANVDQAARIAELTERLATFQPNTPAPPSPILSPVEDGTAKPTVLDFFKNLFATIDLAFRMNEGERVKLRDVSFAQRATYLRELTRTA